MLYKDEKDVSVAARLFEGDPAEAGGLSASSLPWSIDRPARMPDCPLKSLYTKQWLIALPRLEEGRIAELAIFVSASHQTGLDTKSMTRTSIRVGI